MSTFGGGVTSGHHPLNPAFPLNLREKDFILCTLCSHTGDALSRKAVTYQGEALAAEPGTALPPPPSGPLRLLFLLLFQPELRNRTLSMQLQEKQRKSSAPYSPLLLPASIPPPQHRDTLGEA